MVPAICILNCIATASPHVRLMSAARYHQLYGNPALVNWTPLWANLAALAVMTIAIGALGYSIRAYRRALRKLQVIA